MLTNVTVLYEGSVCKNKTFHHLQKMKYKTIPIALVEMFKVDESKTESLLYWLGQRGTWWLIQIATCVEQPEFEYQPRLMM